MTPRERQRKDESSDSFAPEISGEREQATSLKEASTPPGPRYDDTPILKIEDRVPIDNPATAAMPVTLSAVPPAEPSATVSAPSQPQVLAEIVTRAAAPAAVPAIPEVELTDESFTAGARLTGREKARFFAEKLLAAIDQQNVRFAFLALRFLADRPSSEFRDEIQNAFNGHPPADINLSYFNRAIELAQSDNHPRVGEMLREWTELKEVEKRLVKQPLFMTTRNESMIRLTLRGVAEWEGKSAARRLQ